jgi:hypothetical protein
MYLRINDFTSGLHTLPLLSKTFGSFPEQYNETALFQCSESLQAFVLGSLLPSYERFFNKDVKNSFNFQGSDDHYIFEGSYIYWFLHRRITLKLIESDVL